MMHVAFGNLRRACINRGMFARLDMHDAGQSITITERDTGRKVFEWHSDWGEGDVTSHAAEWLVENDMLNAQDLEG